jgi:hypothetical protein
MREVRILLKSMGVMYFSGNTVATYKEIHSDIEENSKYIIFNQ